jgi:hypothetical protein
MSSKWRRAALHWTAFVAEWSSVFVEGVPRGPETLVWCRHCERWLMAGECWLDLDGHIVCGTWACTGSLRDLSADPPYGVERPRD